MSAAEIIKDLPKLTRTEQEQLRDLLDDLLEDRLELREEFKAEIEAGKKDIAEGRYRARKPGIQRAVRPRRFVPTDLIAVSSPCRQIFKSAFSDRLTNGDESPRLSPSPNAGRGRVPAARR